MHAREKEGVILTHNANSGSYKHCWRSLARSLLQLVVVETLIVSGEGVLKRIYGEGKAERRFMCTSLRVFLSEFHGR